MNLPTRRSRGGDPGSDTIAHHIAGTTTSNNQRTARLDEEADKLLIEGARFLEAAQSALAHGLLEDTHEELVLGSAHAVVCISRALRLVSFAVHVDLAEAAA